MRDREAGGPATEVTRGRNFGGPLRSPFFSLRAIFLRPRRLLRLATPANLPLRRSAGRGPQRQVVGHGDPGDPTAAAPAQDRLPHGASDASPVQHSARLTGRFDGADLRSDEAVP